MGKTMTNAFGLKEPEKLPQNKTINDPYENCNQLPGTNSTFDVVFRGPFQITAQKDEAVVRVMKIFGLTFYAIRQDTNAVNLLCKASGWEKKQIKVIEPFKKNHPDPSIRRYGTVCADTAFALTDSSTFGASI